MVIDDVRDKESVEETQQQLAKSGTLICHLQTLVHTQLIASIQQYL